MGAANDARPAPISVGVVNISDQFRTLDPRNIRVDQIASLIFSAILFMGAAIGLLILWLKLGVGTIWISVSIGASLLVVTSFVGAWFWPPVEFRFASWRLDEQGMEIRRGVFWRHQVIIPLGRVQHADVSQGPLQRVFGLGSITINTAGTQNSTVKLEGLAHTTAIELRDLIVRQRTEQNVV